MAAIESTRAPSTVNPSWNHNLSVVADVLGDLQLELRELEARVRGLKDELLEAGVDRLDGQRWSVRVSRSVRTSLDVDKARQLLGDLADSCTRFTPVSTVRLTARAAA